MQIKNESNLIGSITVITLPIILYWRDLIIVINDALKSELTNYILFIPLFLAYVVYRVRHRIFISISGETGDPNFSRYRSIEKASGVLLCVLAYIIKWYGSYTFQPLEIHMLSLPLFIMGLIIILFNFQTFRVLLFPVSLLFFLVPPPLQYVNLAGMHLSAVSSQVTYNIIRLFGVNAALGTLYDSPVILVTHPPGNEMRFAIDVACSGLYSLMGFIIFIVFISYLFRGSFIKKFSILLLGLPLIYVLNILRITMLIFIGMYMGETIAYEAFHIFGGWTLIFIGSIVLLMISGRIFKNGLPRMRIDERPHGDEHVGDEYCYKCGEILKTTQNKLNKKSVVAISLLIAITLSTLLLEAPTFALTEGTEEISIHKVNPDQEGTKILPQVEGYQLRFVHRDVEFENLSGEDASLIYQYVSADESDPYTWILIEVSDIRSSLHGWEFCLITYPERAGRRATRTQLELTDIHLSENPPLSARYFVFRDNISNYTQAILYWFTKSVYRTAEGHQPKWSKISIVKYVADEGDLPTIKGELRRIGEAIVDKWEPVETWSWLSLAISKNGAALILLTTSLILGTMIYYGYLKRKIKSMTVKSNKYLLSKMTNLEDKNILNVLREYKKELVNEEDIEEKYKSMTGNNINKKILYKKLIEAEKIGIIERKIININDRPYIKWKINL